MKRKILAVLTAAGVLGVTGAAFADIDIHIGTDSVKFKPIAKTQNQLPPESPKDFNNGQRPPEPPRDFQSRDMNGRPPKEAHENKRPPMSGDRQPPPKPRSGDLPPHMNQQQGNHPKMR